MGWVVALGVVPSGFLVCGGGVGGCSGGFAGVLGFVGWGGWLRCCGLSVCRVV